MSKPSKDDKIERLLSSVSTDVPPSRSCSSMRFSTSSSDVCLTLQRQSSPGQDLASPPFLHTSKSPILEEPNESTDNTQNPVSTENSGNAETAGESGAGNNVLADNEPVSVYAVRNAENNVLADNEPVSVCAVRNALNIHDESNLLNIERKNSSESLVYNTNENLDTPGGKSSSGTSFGVMSSTKQRTNSKKEAFFENKMNAETTAALHDISKDKKSLHVFAFVNPKSGGSLGGEIMVFLQKELGVENVCDLSKCEPPEIFIERMIVSVQKKSRLVVCGGDGTASWILNALATHRASGKLKFQPPVALIPLGTGNDLARSLGWGHSVQSTKQIPGMLEMTRRGNITLLDQWEVIIIPKGPVPKDHKLKSIGSHPQLVKCKEMRDRIKDRLLNGDYVGEDEPTIFNGSGYVPDSERKTTRKKRIRERLHTFLNKYSDSELFQGTFQNYFSIGIDAAVTLAVENVRNTKCGACTFKCGVGKMWYGLCAPSHTGMCKWFPKSLAEEIDFYSCEKLREDNVLDEINLRKRYIQTEKSAGRMRSLVFLNINSFSAGTSPYRNDLGKQRPHDGLIEVLAARDGFALGCNQLCSVGFETITRGKGFVLDIHQPQYMQTDGEGWKLDFPCLLMVTKVRTAVMLRAPKYGCYWEENKKPAFWPIVAKKDDIPKGKVVRSFVQPDGEITKNIKA